MGQYRLVLSSVSNVPAASTIVVTGAVGSLTTVMPGLVHFVRKGSGD